MIGSQHLTSERLDQVITHPGQAHFALLDTKHTCRECGYWLNQTGLRSQLKLLKPARCLKALRDAPPIPHNATACKHFEPASNPPPV